MNRGQDPEPPGPGPGGDAHFLEDAIVLEPDNNNQQAIPDNTAPGVEGAGSSVAVVNIGVPLPDFNIHDSVFYSHHYFEKVRGEDGKTTFKAKCLICWKEKKEETIIKTTDNSTKGLMVHLQTHNEKYVKKLLSQRDHVDGLKKKAKEMRKKSFDGTKQMKLFASGSDKTLRVEQVGDKAMQERYDKARVTFAARTMTSFYSLQHTDLFAKALLPKTHHRLQHKTAKTISIHCGKMADEMRRDIFSIILGEKDSCQTFSFTSDMWKSGNCCSFVALTIHFLTKNWDLVKLLPFSEYFGASRKHTAENILLSLDSMMAVFGIEGSDFSKYILLDNASNNKKAMRLSDDYLPVWCCNHTLQLAIGDSFKAKLGQVSIKRILTKCKAVSKLVRRSEANRDALKEACEVTNTAFILPFKPGATRWNSKLMNVSDVVRLQPALQHLSVNDIVDTWSVDVPTAREFETAKAMKKCLEPMKIATKKWESDREPTLHKVVRELWNIKTVLDNLSTTGDNVKMFARNLQRNIDKRFKNCGTEEMIFCIAHFLDPDLRGLILKEYDGVYERTIAEIKRRCQKFETAPVQLHGEQRRGEPDEDSGDEHLTGAQQLKKRRRLTGDGVAAAPPPILSKIDVEIQNYESLQDDEDCANICKWWSRNRGAFVLLEQLAREVLSIPASSSSSERTFSAGTRACSAKRHNLSPKRISDLMILNVNEDDVERYREKYGIKNLFEGDILKLVDVEFVTDQRMAEETLPPPLYELEDEFFDEIEEESDLEDGESDTDEDVDDDTEDE